MGMQIFTADDRTTITWAGGTSTQIFIHPSNGNFAERDFIFRISTATVEAEESAFTFFEGIMRHLMILKGKLELIHEGRYTKYLTPYDQDTFSGEWNTRSKGKVTDFNLMLKEGATGSLTHHHIEQGSSMKFTAKANYYFIYLASGTAGLSDGNTAKAGDLLRLDKGFSLSMHAQESSDLVIIEAMV
jgi:environmental stress-induced protein Ves